MLLDVVSAAAFISESCALLQIASNSLIMVPLELKVAEVESHDQQIFISAICNPNGAILAAFWTVKNSDDVF